MSPLERPTASSKESEVDSLRFDGWENASAVILGG